MRYVVAMHMRLPLSPGIPFNNIRGVDLDRGSWAHKHALWPWAQCLRSGLEVGIDRSFLRDYFLAPFSQGPEFDYCEIWMDFLEGFR